MNINGFKFEKLNKEQVYTLVDWANKEGWNPGPFDAEVYWQTDQDGFYGLFEEEKLIGGGSIVSYNGEYGFMGFFIMLPEYRGKGLGKKLWYARHDTLINRLKPNAPIGMDGVVDMQSFYSKGGFNIEFRDERRERIGEKFSYSNNITKIYKSDYDRIIEYDSRCFGFKRAQFLKPWIELPETVAFQYTDENKLKGYSILRKANLGYKICPLFADNFEIAEQLYKACLSAVPNETVFLDIPMNNKEAVRLAKNYNTKYVFECARMYYNNPPQVESDKVFGITTFELG